MKADAMVLCCDCGESKKWLDCTLTYRMDLAVQRCSDCQLLEWSENARTVIERKAEADANNAECAGTSCK